MCRRTREHISNRGFQLDLSYLNGMKLSEELKAEVQSQVIRLQAL